MAADDNYDDDTIDELIANVPCTTLDSRTYSYTRYPGVKIMYNRTKFQHTIALGLINIPKPVYVAGFGESMLLTWVGLECSVRRRVVTSYTINLKVVNGIHMKTHTTPFSPMSKCHPKSANTSLHLYIA